MLNRGSVGGKETHRWAGMGWDGKRQAGRMTDQYIKASASAARRIPADVCRLLRTALALRRGHVGLNASGLRKRICDDSVNPGQTDGEGKRYKRGSRCRYVDIRRGSFCEGLARANEVRCQRGSAVTNERKRGLKDTKRRRGGKKNPLCGTLGGFL